MRDEPIPDDMKEIAEKYHTELIEHVVEQDEALMEKYFEGEEITVDEIKATIRKSTIANTMVPGHLRYVLPQQGRQETAGCHCGLYARSYGRSGYPRCEPGYGRRRRAPFCQMITNPFAALAFKIATDPFVGKLAFFRVYSGTVEAGTTVYNSVKDADERMGRILQMHANHRQDIPKVYAGDIASGCWSEEHHHG